MNISSTSCLGLLLAALSLPLTWAANDKLACPILPLPQEVQLKADAPRLKHAPILRVSKRSEGDAKIWERIPKKEGAYALSINNKDVVIYAESAVGRYYARQSLIQLLQLDDGSKKNLEAQRDPYKGMKLAEIMALGSLPQGLIIDWPDLPYRGTVEGYYGNPWTHEGRKAQFAFYGRNKMNTYIWAPKDDPYHHGAKCRDPYPEEQAKQIAELVQEANKHHVKFIWAIHPNNTVRWAEKDGKPDLDALCAKLEMMYKLGVRHFGVFVDDSGGEINKASNQVKLCDYINKNFNKKHKDVGPIIMCPTGYNKAWANEGYLRELGSDMPKDVRIMWTGNTVVHDITLEGQQWVNERVERPTFIWWNWPCNDFMRSNICMGRTYGLEQDRAMLQSMSGFVSNPMEYSEASKVGLYGVAAYTWNIMGFESDATWKEGIKRLYPANSAAMQVFCNHNSDLGPNFHGYRREESVAIAPTAQQLRDSMQGDTLDNQAADAMLAEFCAMERAGQVLLHADEFAPVKAEIELWMQHFLATAKAGRAAIDYVRLRDKANVEDFWAMVDACQERREANEGKQLNVLNGRMERKNAITGKLVIAPLLNDLVELANARAVEKFSGQNLGYATPRFTCQGGDAARNPEKLFDGDDRSFWEKSGYQQVGDWYALDFGAPRALRSVKLLMGGPRPNDYIGQGQLEYSLDGENWIALGAPCSGASVTLDLSAAPIVARHLRYRVLEARPNWLTICAFEVNRSLPGQAKSNMGGLANINVSRNDKYVGIDRVMEIHPMQPGQFIEMQLPIPVAATWLEINLENANIDQWGDVSLTLADGSSVPAKCYKQGTMLISKGDALPKQKIAGVRLSNKSDKSEEVKLSMFKLDCPPLDPRKQTDSLVDGNILSDYDSSEGLELDLPLPAGAKSVTVLGKNMGELSINGKPLKPRGPRQQVLDGLPVGAKSIRLKAPAQKDAVIYELIFR